MLVTGFGLGLTIPSAINTGTFGVQPSDAGVASATINTGQQIGGSIGTALLNTIATSAVASYIAGVAAGHPAAARPSPAALQAIEAAAAVHGYTTAFWWTSGIFAVGGIVCGSILRWGPLARQAEALPSDGQAGASQLPTAAQAPGNPGA
jgi:hypothetical protein